MAVAKKTIDKYANMAAITVEMATANTTAYKSFNFPFSAIDKVAILIGRIEYTFRGMHQLNSANDAARGGLCCASSVASVDDLTDPLILDSMRAQRLDFGTAANSNIFWQPFVKDFSTLPGGGLLVAPTPLYAFMGSSNAADVMQLDMRFFFNYVSLATEDYWELVETRRIISG